MFCTAVLRVLVFHSAGNSLTQARYCLLGENLLPTAATVFDEYILPFHHSFNKAARQQEGAWPAQSICD